MTKKKVIIIAIVLGGLFFFYKLGDMFAPGSYPYAEDYELNYPEDKVIEKIKELKLADTGLVVPKIGEWELIDGKEGETDYWYHFYFYDKERNQIIHTWTRPSGQNTTTFAFVGINEGLDLGHWKEVNDDFGFFENRKIKENFEQTILQRVKKNLESD